MASSEDTESEPSSSLSRQSTSHKLRQNETSAAFGATSSESGHNHTPQAGPSATSGSSPQVKLPKIAWAKPTQVVQPKVKANTSEARTSDSRSKLQAAYKSFYSYDRIPSHQIRLLIIKPGAPKDELNVTLFTLEDSLLGTEDYPYVALSYHWGNDPAEKAIIVQDDPASKPIKSWDAVIKGALGRVLQEKKFFIKPNLYEALKHLRDPKVLVSAWVDALCINQNDEVEKSEQVRKMAGIYSNAYNVCIWLGFDDAAMSSSVLAMNFIPEAIDPEQHEQLLKDPNKIASWASIFELFKWSWFSRRWIIQELALAKRATVHCGNSEAINWRDFQDAIAIFCRDFDVLRPNLRAYYRENCPDQDRWNNDADFEIEQLGAKLLVELTSNLFRKNADGSSESTYGLETLVSLLSGFDTSDPRDTINALISISSEFNRQTPEPTLAIPPPDYSKNLFQVYRDFVKWVVKTSDSLDIICRHWALPEREHVQPKSSQTVVLPTWIQSVDDSAFGRGEAVFEGRRAGESLVGLPNKTHYHASGRGYWKKSPQVSWPADGTTVEVTGLVIGTVVFRTEPFPDGVIGANCLERLGWTPENEATEPAGIPDQLWQTLVADRGPKGAPVEPFYRRACEHILAKKSRNGHINIETILRDMGQRKLTGYTKDYLERVRAVTWDRSFIEGCPVSTKKNKRATDCLKLVGLGPPKTKKKDVIAILYGCSVPVILRPVRKSDDSIEGYQFIGEAFIYGKMDGEALYGGYDETYFRLV